MNFTEGTALQAPGAVGTTIAAFGVWNKPKLFEEQLRCYIWMIARRLMK